MGGVAAAAGGAGDNQPREEYKSNRDTLTNLGMYEEGSVALFVISSNQTTYKAKFRITTTDENVLMP